MNSSDVASVVADIGQNAPQQSHSLDSGVLVGTNVSKAYNKMDPQLQESFDPLIQKFCVLVYVKKPHKEKKNCILLTILSFLRVTF